MQGGAHGRIGFGKHLTFQYLVADRDQQLDVLTHVLT